MGIKVNSHEVAQIFKGADEISAVYSGGEKIWNQLANTVYIDAGLLNSSQTPLTGKVTVGNGVVSVEYDVSKDLAQACLSPIYIPFEGVKWENCNLRDLSVLYGDDASGGYNCYKITVYQWVEASGSAVDHANYLFDSGVLTDTFHLSDYPWEDMNGTFAVVVFPMIQ